MNPLERLLVRYSKPPAAPELTEPEPTSERAFELMERACPQVLGRVAGAAVLDYGCGTGVQAVAFAEAGAARVTGVDINPRWLAEARRLADARGVGDRVRFLERFPDAERGTYDLVLSQNAMEHYPDPAAALAEMASALRPDGELVVTFGPPWYAPYGAHMHFFTRIPWVHLLFPETVVMRVRNRYRSDGARRYEEVEGGLNRMSMAKLRGLIERSGLECAWRRDEYVKGLRGPGRLPVLRELLTNHVTVILRRPGSPVRA